MMKNITSNLLVVIAFLVGSFNANSQASVCLGTDASVCIGSSIDIVDCNPGSVSGIVLPSPTNVSLSDDSWSAAVPLGFTANFYGTNYTQCVIGSNGVVSFNLGNANGYCPWALGGAGTMPNPGFAAALNSMMPAYHDINPANSPGGSIYYQTIGTAPNRQFVVVYKNLSAFGPPGFCIDMALIVNETSNVIEYHISYKALSPTWNGGLGIQGVQNATGTVASITPGRNNSQWSILAPEAKAWTPTSPTNTSAYSISNIPFQPIVNAASGGSLAWGNTLNNTQQPYNNGTLTVNPVLPGTTGYFLVSSLPVACSNNPAIANSDTTFITGVSSQVSAASTPDICSASQGTVTATPVSGIPAYTYSWPTLGGATTQTVTGVGAGTYQVVMTDGNGCSSTANVTVGDTPAAFSGSTTVVSCPGGNDGTATATMTPPLGTITYQWDDPLMQTTQTAVGLTAGQYNCTVTSDVGCTDIVTVDVTEIPGMIGVIASQSDVTCNSGNDGIIDVDVTQGTGPYTYSWDNSISMSDVANDLAAGTHTVTITDANGCIITVTGTISEPAPLTITSLTPDTQICPEDDIMLTAVGTGGSSPYTFTWTEAGAVIGTGTTITVDPAVTNTQYCVTLSEVCGSPTTNECMIVTFPTPIEPSATVDEAEKCMPGRFEFTNTSTNAAEIATTYWEFGPDGATLETGADSTHYQFNEVGIFDVIMTTTSIYGCVYTDTMEQIVEVKPNPIADFTFSTNPTTIFEPAVQMQDRSSVDVIAYSWYSPNSNPTTSGISDPKFYFPEEVGSYPVTLAVVTEHGCVDTLTLYLNVVQDILFFAPNAFTPDGDEFNQLWKAEIQGIDVYDFELLIFNRWGEVIWESRDPSIGWDGTYNGQIVQSGMYTWVARVKDLYNDANYEFNGSINLLK
ncbi:MAG: gliding motility-associated C-terminal domain-containing protein [Crocinitomicaceae bacterium]